MKKLYLDIDGVLLTTSNIRAAKGAVDLLYYVLENFDCYWLTTHCHDNDTTHAISYLSQYFYQSVVEKMKSIKPAAWTALKTEGIDFESDFIWLDDYPREAEKDVLRHHGCYRSLIQVNLDNKDELFDVIQKLKALQ